VRFSKSLISSNVTGSRSQEGLLGNMLYSKSFPKQRLVESIKSLLLDK
jgi:hypothetical protein